MQRGTGKLSKCNWAETTCQRFQKACYLVNLLFESRLHSFKENMKKITYGCYQNDVISSKFD